MQEAVLQNPNDEARMTNQIRGPNDEPGAGARPSSFVIRVSSLIRHSSFGFRHLAFAHRPLFAAAPGRRLGMVSQPGRRTDSSTFTP